MTQDPDQIRSEIEQTRAGLATDVNLLTEKVSPARVVERRVDSAKEAVGNLTGKVFGRDDKPEAASPSAVPPGAYSPLTGGTEAVRKSPELAKQKAAGSPLIAGAVAFGAGYLLSALLPAGRQERQAAGRLSARLQDLKEPVQQQVKTIADEVKQDLQPQLQDAVATVKDTAAQAAEQVRGSAGAAGGRITDQTKEAVGAVKEQAAGSPAEPSTPGTSTSWAGAERRATPRFTPYPGEPARAGDRLTGDPLPGGPAPL